MKHDLPNISIIIPVRNGMKTIVNLIDSIRKQLNVGFVQIIVIDSGSTDGTLEYLSTIDVDLLEIPSHSFSHGGTRNLGLTLAKYDLIQFTVQDACPVDDYWLEKMSFHFNDQTCSAVSGMQIVLPGNNVNPHAIYRPSDLPTFFSVQFLNVEDFNELDPNTKRNFCRIDNVNAMYRKSVLISNPFVSVDFGEDMLWARMALEKGMKIIYDHRVFVNHYHFEFPNFIFNRTLIELLYKCRFFGITHHDSHSFRDYLLIIYRNFVLNCSLKWIWHNFRILYFTNKAINLFNAKAKTETLDSLFDHFKINIPIGNAKS